jgi:hypothetical protein
MEPRRSSQRELGGPALHIIQGKARRLFEVLLRRVSPLAV